MYLEGVGIRKQGLDVGKVQACLRLWQLMPAVCRRKTGLDVLCPQFAQTKCSVKQGWILENLTLASKFDNLCPQFAEGTSIRFSKSLEYVYYSLLLLFTKKKRLIEPKDLNNGDFTWNRVLSAIVG